MKDAHPYEETLKQFVGCVPASIIAPLNRKYSKIKA